MAFKCAHCGSPDVAALFKSYECFACGKHTTDDGRQILPDSLCCEPNIDHNMAQYGWPYEDTQTSIERGQEIIDEQWGRSVSNPVAPTGPVSEAPPEPPVEQPAEEVPAL